MENEPQKNQCPETNSFNEETKWEETIEVSLPNSLSELENLKRTNTLVQKEIYQMLFSCQNFLQLDSDFDFKTKIFEVIEHYNNCTNWIFRDEARDILELIEFDFTRYAYYENNLEWIFSPIYNEKTAASFRKIMKGNFINCQISFLEETINKINSLFYYIEKKLKCGIVDKPIWCKTDLDYAMYQKYHFKQDSKTDYGTAKNASTAARTINRRINRLILYYNKTKKKIPDNFKISVKPTDIYCEIKPKRIYNKKK